MLLSRPPHCRGRRGMGGSRMKVLCFEAGPAGLYFTISMKLRDLADEVTVRERNHANDTFGGA